MKKIFKQLKHKLTPTEHSDIKRNLVAYMSSHPAPTKTRWHEYRLLSSRFALVTAVALIVVGLTGSTAYAAEDSLPGDVLYPIKINITEPVHAKLLFNDEAKANWEGERAARRLDEAEKLAKLGRLNEQKQTELEVRFKEHTLKLNARITRLETIGNQTKADIVRQKFNQLIQTHQKKLQKIDDEETIILSASSTLEAETKKSEPDEKNPNKPPRPVHTMLRLLEKTRREENKPEPIQVSADATTTLQLDVQPTPKNHENATSTFGNQDKFERDNRKENREIKRKRRLQIKMDNLEALN